MDTTKHVQFSFKELHSMAISLWRNVSLIFHPMILKISHIELPQIFHSFLRVFASENVHILPICCCSASASWHWQIGWNIRQRITIACFRAWKQSTEFVLCNVILINWVQIVCILPIVSTKNHYFFLFSILQINASEWV